VNGDKMLAARLLGIGKTTLYEAKGYTGVNSAVKMLPAIAALRGKWRGPDTVMLGGVGGDEGY
jgi:hypothetical protein